MGLFWYTDEQLQYFCVFSGGIVCVGIDSNIAQVYWTSSFMPSFPHVYLPVSPCVITPTPTLHPLRSKEREKKSQALKVFWGFCLLMAYLMFVGEVPVESKQVVMGLG